VETDESTPFLRNILSYHILDIPSAIIQNYVRIYYFPHVVHTSKTVRHFTAVTTVGKNSKLGSPWEYPSLSS
jgi:hypothetical protein